MKVNFQTDYRDFAEAMWLASDAKAAYKNSLINFIFLHAIIAAVSSFVILMFAPHIIYAAVNFAIIFLLCFYIFRPPNSSYYVIHYRNVYGSKPFNYEIEINDEAVEIGDESSKSIIAWKKIKEIIETDENIFLISKHRYGVKIPKSAFPEPLKIGEFIAFATSRIPAPDEALNVRNN